MRIILFCFFVTAYLHGEVQSVSLQWDRRNCLEDCQDLLRRYLSKVKGVTDLRINPLSGQAFFSWDPEIPFSYHPLRRAMQRVGVGLQHQGVRLKVRGQLEIKKEQVILISEGDQTPFLLMSPIQPQKGKYTTRVNLSRPALTPQDLQRLSQLAETKAVVSVEGPLFKPDRSPPLQLVIERLQ